MIIRHIIISKLVKNFQKYRTKFLKSFEKHPVCTSLSSSFVKQAAANCLVFSRGRTLRSLGSSSCSSSSSLSLICSIPLAEDLEVRPGNDVIDIRTEAMSGWWSLAQEVALFMGLEETGRPHTSSTPQSRLTIRNTYAAGISPALRPTVA